MRARVTRESMSERHWNPIVGRRWDGGAIRIVRMPPHLPRASADSRILRFIRSLCAEVLAMPLPGNGR